MGVDSVWLAEYHFIPCSVLSSLMTVGTAIAARTDHMRIGFGVLLLPLGNPVRIAEEVATLDHISRGRVDFGIGRGTFPIIRRMGYPIFVNPSRSLRCRNWRRTFNSTGRRGRPPGTRATSRPSRSCKGTPCAC
jgi:alkanesulfonate monooxygenase SsuD/methylene tetrahydromethanopterin reductase-like flavin-dependent oxidoreductase (luciferase family)